MPNERREPVRIGAARAICADDDIGLGLTGDLVMLPDACAQRFGITRNLASDLAWVPPRTQGPSHHSGRPLRLHRADHGDHHALGAERPAMKTDQVLPSDRLDRLGISILRSCVRMPSVEHGVEHQVSHIRGVLRADLQAGQQMLPQLLHFPRRKRSVRVALRQQPHQQRKILGQRMSVETGRVDARVKAQARAHKLQGVVQPIEGVLSGPAHQR